MANNALYTGLNHEYERAKQTLVKRIPKQNTRKDVVELLQSALALATERQSHQCVKLLPRSFRVGFVLEAKSIKATVKARGYKAKVKVTSAAASAEVIAFDYSKVSTTHLNQVTRDTIGSIGLFNKGISKQLIAKYDVLVANNVLVSNISKYGFTAEAGTQLVKQGISPEMVAVIKSQSTTSKMITILEQQGIRGGMPPSLVSELLIPEIRAMFGAEGVVIDNVGKMRKILRVNAAGEYWWDSVKIKRPYKTTTKNYADMVASTSMKRAQNEGRLATMRQSGLVDKYRFISAQTGNTCLTCLGMHGLIVNPSDVCPPIHVKCYCHLSPVYKDPNLNLHGNEYYMKQRDAGLWRKHQFNEYNKGLVPKERISNPNFLPPDMLKSMPSGVKMEKIRTSLLGDVGKAPIKRMTPKMQIIKDKKVKLTDIDKMKPGDKLKIDRVAHITHGRKGADEWVLNTDTGMGYEMIKRFPTKDSLYKYVNGEIKDIKFTAPQVYPKNIPIKPVHETKYGGADMNWTEVMTSSGKTKEDMFAYHYSYQPIKGFAQKTTCCVDEMNYNNFTEIGYRITIPKGTYVEYFGQEVRVNLEDYSNLVIQKIKPGWCPYREIK